MMKENSSVIRHPSSIHIPVLLDRVIETLGDINCKTVIDATLGAGGYSRRFLELGATVIAFDRDPTVQKFADALLAEYPDKFQLINAPFSKLAEPYFKQNIEDILSFPRRREQGLKIDGLEINAIVFDLGISSMQIDTPDRGFSWRFDSPLDMRMNNNDSSTGLSPLRWRRGGPKDRGSGQTAADLIEEIDQQELSQILRDYGNLKNARAIAAAVKKHLPQTTFQLRDLIHNPKDVAPVFQAIRIAVNDEMGELERALAAAPELLAPGGICAAVTFHSLEDRIVKQKFRELTTPLGDPKLPNSSLLTPNFSLLKTYRPDAAELELNSRARSAHLRAIKRVA